MSLLLILLFCLNSAISLPQQPVYRARSIQRSSLTGVYRIDIPASDKLYSVVAGASSKVPFSEQQRFFIDLAVRLTPPDLLAIEQRGTRISLGSSRAPRMDFVADGVAHNTRARDGHLVRARFAVESAGGSQRLVFTSTGKTEDNFSVVFESLDNGRRLRVVRRISAESLDQPLVIQTIYNKISDVARWELYGETLIATSAAKSSASPSPGSPTVSGSATVSPTIARPPSAAGTRVRGPGSAGADTSTADVLRRALHEWIDATNNRDIEKQMAFYVPRLKAYYLTRNTSRDFVREEKARVFERASVIDIRAEEPEIIFQDGGRTAVMRYRKKYRIENGRRSRRGEVIQELRWQLVGENSAEPSWRIFSERDIRVL
ncbi:MAG TPA: hypothetical protein VFR80_00645 [Pyrinomonadaceae bacterium]|nr:hypothetical protein [Pyrinomonadaceae bacterium]